MSNTQWLFQAWADAVPSTPPTSVVEWARQHVKLVGSARSESFDPDITPWTREPLECAANDTRKCTLVLPIQSGKSAVGEIAICYWLANFTGGDIQYNWQNDLAADARWKKRVEKILKACGPLMDRTSADRFAWTKGMVNFPHANLIMQGVFTDRNVASDSIRCQVNEEIHDAQGWLPGRLAQAHGRTTAFWNSVIFNISNASRKGDQLEQAFLSGTQQCWEVKCPGCGLFHRMRTKWEDDKPELGGLRYNADADGCRLSNGSYDYNKLAPTVFYQMPCKHRVRDNVSERRALSLSGRYSEPDNPGAPLTERSYTMEAVSIDYIPWLDLIREKHVALRAYKRGDPSLWDVYRRERECLFTDPEDRPIVREIVLSAAKKNRAGMPNRAVRYGLLDRQQGTIAKGELPHWWLLIIDFDAQGNALIVWEGKCLSDLEAVSVLKEHNVEPLCVTCDSGWDTSHVYSFCLQNGFCCIKVEGDKNAIRLFPHADGSQRIYSPPAVLHRQLGLPPSQTDPAKEPRFWHVSKWGAMERLAYVQASKELKFEIPSDVSQDFKSHMEAWVMDSRRVAVTGETRPTWKQVRERDDLFQLCAYAVVCAEMDKLIGIGSLPPVVSDNGSNTG